MSMISRSRNKETVGASWAEGAVVWIAADSGAEDYDWANGSVTLPKLRCAT